MHTLQDATSPVHCGFQGWGGWPASDPRTVEHGIKESGNPGWGSDLYWATWLADLYFEGGVGFTKYPTDFFYLLGCDGQPSVRAGIGVIAGSYVGSLGGYENFVPAGPY